MDTTSQYAKGGLWYGTSGPPDAKIVIVGESWGVDEAREQRPFVGSSGTELNRMLAEAGLNRDEIFCTNLVAERPFGNDMWRFFDGPEISNRHTYRGLSPRENVRIDVARMYRQIASYPRSLVISVGNWSLWALVGKHGIGRSKETEGRNVPTGILNHRGSMWFVEPMQELWERESISGVFKLPLPCLPIIHPAAIMRDWSLRAVTVHDLKASVPKALRNDWRPNPPPIILAPPTFAEATTRLRHWLALADGGQIVRLAEDIETARQTVITCIGFSDSLHFAMSLPFVQRTPSGLDSYWSLEQEATLFSLIRRINSHPNIKIEGQNFIYDTQFIQMEFGVTPKLDHDTMLGQNVAFPGTPKDLGYLSSLFCRYHWYWKDDSKDWDIRNDLNQLLAYNALDALRTREIAEAQRSMLKALNLEEQMKIKMRINDLCLRMMNRGVKFDTKRRNDMLNALDNAKASLENELYQLIPQDWAPLNKTEKSSKQTPWFRSDKKVKHILYNELGLPVIKHRKTGAATSGEEARNELKKRVPQFSGLFNRLEMYESVDHTRGVIKSGLDPDGRMRCSFNPGGTETHRLSSSANAFGRGTNLQNLTKGKEDD